MATSPQWLSLTDLGRMYGLSAIDCGKTLKNKGWRDENGFPTNSAVEAGAVTSKRNNNFLNNILWNAKVCKELFEKTGYQTMTRALEISQWARLLEAMDIGSPSITTTAKQMAEELPKELIEEVNIQLELRGSTFRVN